MKYEKLRLGLDLGTNSVGWALLDENNHLVKKNGHTFWGVRMFNEASTEKKTGASTKKKRGVFRRNRRRLNRRKIYRTNLLRELFSEEIAKVDPSFFQRLDDSFFKIEDKRNNNYHNLFTDGYTDKEFFAEYPTIYHLRHALMTEDKKFDIRMVYLAINHIIKYRGHFLRSGEVFEENDNSQVVEAFNNINDAIVEAKEKIVDEEEETYEDYFTKIDLDNFDYSRLSEILNSSEKLNDKKNELLVLFNVDRKTIVNEFIIPLLVGSKVNVSKLKPLKDENHDDLSVNVDVDNLEEEIDKWASEIKNFSDMFYSVKDIKSIIDYHYLLKILRQSNSLSEAMIIMYDDHQKDLKRLKAFFKKYSPSDYKLCFKVNENGINNYSRYVGSVNVSSKMKRFKHCSRVEFYKFLEGKLETIITKEAQEEKEYFLDKINKGTFLLRQRSNQNGIFPKQLHQKELQTILDNQSKYHSLFNKNEDGLTVSEKIILIFNFKIPYYVGVLNKNSSYSWVVRGDDRITPWNFDKVVNKPESAKTFIQRIQNKCTYLKGQNDYCLPKFSLLFSEYNCLSYLNKMYINGRLLSPELKQEIVENVFKKTKQPTRKDIAVYIRSNYGESLTTTNYKEIEEVNVNMASYIAFKNIFGEKVDEMRDQVEDIIRDITIFEDKAILEERLINHHHLDKEKVKMIKGLNYKGYGRLCKHLLDGMKVWDPIDGVWHGTVIEIMRNTNMNLQEILYDEHYRLIDEVDSYNKKQLGEVEEEQHSEVEKKQVLNDFIDENITISSPVKRSIIQAYTIIEEIEDIFGKKIDEYYVECTRTNKADKKRSISRYKKIQDHYKSCKREATLFKQELEDNKDNLRSDKIYLYFTQLGKCMYTGNTIEFNQLFDDNITDIDHIYPRAVIKDDSLTNRVLVMRTANANKGDKFLCEFDKFSLKTLQDHYKLLLKNKLISKEKYRRLTQREVNPSDLDGFINRQLVTTNQSVKGLINVLKLYKGVEDKNIIYSKAENVSDFRKKFDLVKSRTANNFHHAHDAYLNVIVGGILNKYYSYNRIRNIKDYNRMKSDGKTINPEKVFEKDTLFIEREELWNKNEMIKKIKADLYERFDINETVKTSRTSEMLHQTTILPAGNYRNPIPVKSNSLVADTTKYGSFTSYSYSKYVIVKVNGENGDFEYKLEAIPTMFESKVDEYLKKSGYKDYEIIHDNIKTGVVVEDGRKKYYVTGVTGNQFLITNLNDRFFAYDKLQTIHKIEKYELNKKYENKMVFQDDNIIVSPARSKKNKEIVITKEECINLLDAFIEHYEKDIYSFSVIHLLSAHIPQKNSREIAEWETVKIVELLTQLLKLLKTNARETANLTSIGMSKTSCTLYLSRTLKNGMKFISESVTGYRRKVIFEVK